MTNTGLSPVAVQATQHWNAGDRPVDWQRRVYGLVVHTTGGGLPAKARSDGRRPTDAAVDWYVSNSHGCHYINGWGGVSTGDLLQIANEDEQANGVGMTNPDDPAHDQRRSIDAGRFEADLPTVLIEHWRRRWPDYRDSLELLPGTRSANSCYIHVECIPCVFDFEGQLTAAAEPMRAGLRFTQAQHDAIVALAVDVAERNGWPKDETWWRTPRLVGHEDLTPLSRHDRHGGWDPGYLRDEPYFDWDYVYAQIEQRLGRSGPVSEIIDQVIEFGRDLADAGAANDERAAAHLAIRRGLTDENAITNQLFAARHPELGGRAIRSDEHELAREWVEVRDDVVRPALTESVDQ